MRNFGWLSAFAVGIALAGPVAAQTTLEGPLALPDATPSAKAQSKPSKASHGKKKGAHRDLAHAAEAYGPASHAPQPVVHAGSETPADPLSVGMKWNGSNDTARETRVQNYDGTAAGTGAEVGLKLHF